MLTKICVIEKRKKMSFIKSTSFEFMKKDKISNVYCLSQVSENSESLENHWLVTTGLVNVYVDHFLPPQRSGQNSSWGYHTGLGLISQLKGGTLRQTDNIGWEGWKVVISGQREMTKFSIQLLNDPGIWYHVP